MASKASKAYLVNANRRQLVTYLGWRHDTKEPTADLRKAALSKWEMENVS